MCADDQPAGHNEKERADVLLVDDVEPHRMGEAENDKVVDEDAIFAVLSPEVAQAAKTTVRSTDELNISPAVDEDRIDRGTGG